MDTITHGIAGALIGKGFFAERYGRVATFAVTLGSVFPDGDVIREVISRDQMALLKYHRGITHSYVALPFFAVGLAWLTRWYTRRRGIACPSWLVLALLYAAGLASHIVLDVLTSFGTRCWDPLSYRRVAWDWLFIVDFLFTGSVLLPQVAAWVYGKRESARGRALRMWVLFSLCAVGIQSLARLIGTPFSPWAILVISLLLAALFFLPAWREWGFGVARASWCRAGFWVAVAYVLACGAAHHAALNRVKRSADEQRLQVESIGAIPLPPSLLAWDGLIRSPQGIYEARFSLTDAQSPEFQFFPEAPLNRYVAEALELPAVKTYMGFARFPVVRYSVSDDERIVKLHDLRFFGRRRRGPQPFTYTVVFDSSGKLIHEGWVRE